MDSDFRGVSPSGAQRADMPFLTTEEIYAAPAHEKEARYAVSRVAAGALFFAVFPSLLASLIYTVLRLVSPALADNIYTHWVLQVVLLYLMALPLSLLIVGRGNGTRAPGTPLRGVEYPVYFCILETVAIAGTLLSSLFDFILSSLSDRGIADSFTDTIAETPAWVILIVVCLIGPVAEELFYRRAILDRLVPYGEKSAILFSALLFGLAHENFGQLFYAFGCGLLLGYIYVRTRDLRATCLLHILFNFSGSFIPVLLLQIEEGSLLSLLLPTAYAVFEYALALVGLILLIVFYRTRVFRNAEKPLLPGRSAGLCFGNVAVILLLFWEVYATMNAALASLV